MSSKKIGIVVGSLRKDSFNKSIAEYVASQAPEGYEMKFVEIGDLPLYNQDYDGDSPAAYTRFREEVKGLDAVLFFTPEHNRSYPAALKNALDVGSRPYGSNVWSGKPGAVVSVSPGAIAGFGANQQLRQVLSFLNLYIMAQPEVYIGGVMNVLDENGKLKDEGTKAFLSDFVKAFVDWVEKFQ
jgi:chromate reductase